MICQAVKPKSRHNLTRFGRWGLIYRRDHLIHGNRCFAKERINTTITVANIQIKRVMSLYSIYLNRLSKTFPRKYLQNPRNSGIKLHAQAFQHSFTEKSLNVKARCRIKNYLDKLCVCVCVCVCV